MTRSVALLAALYLVAAPSAGAGSGADAGAPVPVQLTRQKERLPFKPGDAVVADSEVVELVRPAEGQNREARHRYQILRLSSPGGVESPALDALNARIRSDCFDAADQPTFDETAYFEEIRQRLAERPVLGGNTGASVRLIVNRAPFVAVEACNEWLGPYPAINCNREFARLDTGKGWSWLDAFRPDQRKALLAYCTAKVEKARAEKKKGFGSDWARLAANFGSMDGTFAGRCTEKTIGFGGIDEHGDFVLQMGRGLPHVALAAAYDVVLPAAELRPFVDPKGPLADAVGLPR